MSTGPEQRKDSQDDAVQGPPRGKALVKRLSAPLRKRSLLIRPHEIVELTKIAEDAPSFHNEISVFHTGDQLYQQMLEDISRAREQIVFEMYMVESDQTGWRFARALAERARSGVRVLFIYDAVGSYNAAPDFFKFMRTSGIELLEFRPIRPWAKRFGIFGRNHRKILVVDNRTGYVGGVNLADFWSERHSGKRAWRDTHVRLEGAAALDLGVLFAETWHRETGVLPPLPRRALVESRDDGADQSGGVFIIGGRGRYRGKIRRLYQYEIEKTETQLLLTTPYFVPDWRMRRALFEAAGRGVDVRVLLPAKSDIALADYASRAHLKSYLRRGIRVYFYNPCILHAKTMIADQRWATIGSSNFDSLSLNYNLEANAILLDAEEIAKLETQFWKDLEDARELSLEAWQARPFRARMLERLASLFGPWL